MGVMAHDHPSGHDHTDALRRTAARNVGRLWVALALTVMSLNLLGDGLRDVLDPRLKVQQ